MRGFGLSQQLHRLQVQSDAAFTEMYGETSAYGESYMGIEQVEALGADAVVWATQHGLVSSPLAVVGAAVICYHSICTVSTANRADSMSFYLCVPAGALVAQRHMHACMHSVVQAIGFLSTSAQELGCCSAVMCLVC
jgi:hypothetical protein